MRQRDTNTPDAEIAAPWLRDEQRKGLDPSEGSYAAGVPS